MSFLQSFGLKWDPFFMHPLATDKDLRLFINREKELKNAIEAVRLSKNLLIAGVWGIGKTSFINALRHTLLRKEDNLFFMDVRPHTLLGPKGLNSRSLLVALALELEKQKSPPSDKPFTLERIRRHEEYIDALSRITSIGELLLIIESSIEELQKKGKKVIFIFDDVDKTSFDLKILAGIRDSLWKMNVVYVFSSNIRQYQSVIDSAMEPFFLGILLEGFNELQTKELIDKRIRMASDKSIEDVMNLDAIPVIQRLSQGNPRTILGICDFAFRQAFSRGVNRVAASDVFEYVTKQMIFSSLELNVINILSEFPQGLSVSEIYQKLTKENISISRPRVSQILGALSRRGLVKVRKSGRFNIYTSVISMEVKSE